MKPDIRLIALDLDGTLLNSEKQLTAANRAALEAAAAAGCEIVPATGRFFRAMPACIRELPFLHYAITINGASVYDVRAEKTLCSFEIPVSRALELLSFLDGFPLIYDCYQNNFGYMTASMQEAAGDYAGSPHILDMIRTFRRPVPELKEYLSGRGESVQKLQFFCRDLALRRELMEQVKTRFPELSVTSALPNNCEINAGDANKGNSLRQLAGILGLAREQVMAFGDGGNDLTMLRYAGTGVAMANGIPEAKAAADLLTLSCDEDGVAAAVRPLFP